MESSNPFSPNEYDAYIKKHGRPPTQDPIYNHAAGSPNNRASIDYEDLLINSASNPKADKIEAGSLTQAQIDTLK